MAAARSVLAAHSAAALLCLLAAALPATAQEEVSFRGKTVRVVVGSVPGGITDVGARMIARFLGKHLPQSPTIVVQHARRHRRRRANYFTQQVAPDGLTFLADQLPGDAGRHCNNAAIRHDPTKFLLLAASRTRARCSSSPRAPGVSPTARRRLSSWRKRAPALARSSPRLGRGISRLERALVTGPGNAADRLRADARRGRHDGYCRLR